MADLQLITAKLLLYKAIRRFRVFGTALAEAVAPVVCPEPEKTQYGD